MLIIITELFSRLNTILNHVRMIIVTLNLSNNNHLFSWLVVKYNWKYGHIYSHE